MLSFTKVAVVMVSLHSNRTQTKRDTIHVGRAAGRREEEFPLLGRKGSWDSVKCCECRKEGRNGDPTLTLS